MKRLRLKKVSLGVATSQAEFQTCKGVELYHEVIKINSRGQTYIKIYDKETGIIYGIQKPIEIYLGRLRRYCKEYYWNKDAINSIIGD